LQARGGDFAATYRQIGPTQTPVQLAPLLSPGVKQTVREADNCFTFRVEINNDWSYVSIPPTHHYGKTQKKIFKNAVSTSH
jgi:hypothetical protein